MCLVPDDEALGVPVPMIKDETFAVTDKASFGDSLGVIANDINADG